MTGRCTRFRFHTGSIKRAFLFSSVGSLLLFRFHTGSIKSPPANPSDTQTDRRFDSILVRLKVRTMKKRCSRMYFSFDSILVRLKVRDGAEQLQPLRSFDSILVRLKDAEYVSRIITSATFRFHTGSIKSKKLCPYLLAQYVVSIPYWFD